MVDPLGFLDPYSNLEKLTDSQTIAMLGFSHDPAHQKIVSDLKAKQSKPEPAKTTTNIVDWLTDALDNDGCRPAPNGGWYVANKREVSHVYKTKFRIEF